MPSNRKLVRNAFKCLTCETVIESWSLHDHVACKCEPSSDTRIFVDGGISYPRFGYGIKAEFEDLSEWQEYEVDR